jgi:hypothetical protein
MPGAGPWQDERHRFRRGDKGPTLPPRGYAAPSPSSRGGPGTGSNLRDLTSKDGDVLRARFPAGGSTSNILPKGLPVFRVHQSFSFLHVRNGSTPVIGNYKPNYRLGSVPAVRSRHERQSIIYHLGPLANSKSTFFQATKHIHCTSLGEPFALQQTQSNRDSPFFERKNRRRSHMPGEGDGRGGEGGSASGASAGLGLVAEGGEGASGAAVAAGMGPGTSVARAAGRLPCK